MSYNLVAEYGRQIEGAANVQPRTETIAETLARRRHEDAQQYQLVLMDPAATVEQRLNARRFLVLNDLGDPGPARTDAERACDEQAKLDRKYEQRKSSGIYRTQRAVILDWRSTESEKRAARALLTSLFGKLDPDLEP